MKKMFLVLFFLFFVVNFLFGQSKVNLYLITGHPYNDTDQFFESVLWKYNGDSLVRVEELATDKDLLESIKYYHGEKVVTIFKSNAYGAKRAEKINYRFTVIDFRDSLKVSSYTLPLENYLLIGNYLLKNREGRTIGLV
jgi:hypothetical protein